MANNVEKNSYKHSKKRKRREDRKSAREEHEAKELAKLSTVYSCIMKAREVYQGTRNSLHPLIDALEEKINNSLRFSHEEKRREAEAGMLFLSPTSNRYFIRL